MQFEIANVATSDLDAVLELNESEVPHVGKVDLDRMHWFARHATWFRVAKSENRLAAFLIGLRPGTAYDSLNYRWFCDRYDEFAYIDRIAVAEHARRHGLATLLYDDFAAAMPKSVSIMTCEVNIQPPNDDSMQFHQRLGFRQVGTLTSDEDDKKVAMLLKDL